MFEEITSVREKYMYTATLSNGDVVIALEDGFARSINGNGNRYRIVTHLDENEEVIVDGWELVS